MSLELIISVVVSLFTVTLYVVALWIGDHRTISLLAGVSDLTVAVVVIAIALALAFGLSAQSLVSPTSWLRAVGHLIQFV